MTISSKTTNLGTPMDARDGAIEHGYERQIPLQSHWSATKGIITPVTHPEPYSLEWAIPPQRGTFPKIPSQAEPRSSSAKISACDTSSGGTIAVTM